MFDLPELATSTSFVIEQVKRDSSGCFNVTIRLADGDQRTVYVEGKMLLNFDAFCVMALVTANVVLRHPAEGNPLAIRMTWRDLICEAIKRSTTNKLKTHA